MLCLAVGCLHPDQLLDSLTPDQWIGWMEYFKRHPFGHKMEQWMLGMVASVIANSSGYATTPSGPSDFLPQIEGGEDDDDDQLIDRSGLPDAETMRADIERRMQAANAPASQMQRPQVRRGPQRRVLE